MIADFIVDFVYLATAIKNSVSNCDSWDCEHAMRLLNIICHENGRLMLPVQNEKIDEGFIRPLWTVSDELSALPPSPLYLKAMYVIDSWRQAVRNLPEVTGEEMMRRDIEVMAGMTPMASLLVAQPQAHACITDSTGRIDGQKIYKQKTLKKYFETNSIYETRRLRYLGKQTIIKDNYSHPICFGVVHEQVNYTKAEDFIHQIEIFSAAERNGFQIIDRYAMGGIIEEDRRCQLADLVNRRMRILLPWVDALTSGCPQSGKSVDVYTMFPGFRPKTEDTASYRLDKSNQKSLCEQLQTSCESWSGWSSSDRPHLRLFFLDPDMEDFHDRFICSSTHYFALGKGLDGIEAGSKRCASYNVYYCGRRTRNDIDIDSILECGHRRDERLLCVWNYEMRLRR